ncbi:hypothetical protein T4A_1964 [Trichinella pseudospiralis]|uniref:Uncharacterized protein n=1 Tax=Trichinella pseudospiralis TaxID=6337 RepID=A0A0V1EUS1_TRIPS|nr:hypothetical protein T4A_1964 [Trichinella pseudospiralis]KRZ44737.1 hypothetical protein T4C_12332 [Trichinella pseudospiralis]
MLIFAFSPSKSSNFNRSKSITNDACFIRLIFKQANKQQQQQLQSNDFEISLHLCKFFLTGTVLNSQQN